MNHAASHLKAVLRERQVLTGTIRSRPHQQADPGDRTGSIDDSAINQRRESIHDSRSSWLPDRCNLIARHVQASVDRLQEHRARLPEGEAGQNRRACQVDPSAPCRVEPCTRPTHCRGKEDPPERRTDPHAQHHRAWRDRAAAPCQGAKHCDKGQDRRRIGQGHFLCPRAARPAPPG